MVGWLGVVCLKQRKTNDESRNRMGTGNTTSGGVGGDGRAYMVWRCKKDGK